MTYSICPMPELAAPSTYSRPFDKDRVSLVLNGSWVRSCYVALKTEQWKTVGPDALVFALPNPCDDVCLLTAWKMIQIFSSQSGSNMVSRSVGAFWCVFLSLGVLWCAYVMAVYSKLAALVVLCTSLPKCLCLSPFIALFFQLFLAASPAKISGS